MYKKRIIMDKIEIHFITTDRENLIVKIGYKKRFDIDLLIIPAPITILAIPTERFFSLVNQPVQYGRNIPQVIKNEKKFNDSHC